MATYSTAQVARILGIGTDTLHRWLRERKVPVPDLKSVGGVRVRLWSEDDLAKAKRYKAGHYWGRGGRKPRTKKKEK